MSDIVPAWMWRDPAQIIEQLLAASVKREKRLSAAVSAPVSSSGRDRYYTMARRIHVKQSMRNRR